MQQRPMESLCETPTEISSTPTASPPRDTGRSDIPVRMDPRILDRMYEVVSVLQADYTEILIKQVAGLEQNCLSLSDSTTTAVGKIYETAHEIRGTAGTFGRPLAGKIAARICKYLDAPKAENTIDRGIIQEHIDTLGQVASFTPEPEGIFASIIMKRLEDTTTTPPA